MHRPPEAGEVYVCIYFISVGRIESDGCSACLHVMHDDGYAAHRGTAESMHVFNRSNDYSRNSSVLPHLKKK